MVKVDDILGEDREAKSLIVHVVKPPTAQVSRLLYESTLQNLEEGTQKKWGSGYTYRLDRRSDHHGGNQIHIYGPKNDAWAYRYNAHRSEPNKYTLLVNDVVKDIVSTVFGVSRDLIESFIAIKEENGSLLLEVYFA